jgi:hypothetical protein
MDSEREVLKLSREDGRRIVYEDTSEFEVIYDRVIDNSRWSVHHEIVVKRLSDGKFFKSFYSRGATESQDEQPYDLEYVATFEEVKQVEKVIISYE